MLFFFRVLQVSRISIVGVGIGMSYKQKEEINNVIEVEKFECGDYLGRSDKQGVYLGMENQV